MNEMNEEIPIAKETLCIQCPRCNKIFTTNAEYEAHFVEVHLPMENKYAKMAGYFYKMKVPDGEYQGIIINKYDPKESKFNVIAIDIDMKYDTLSSQRVYSEFDIEHPLPIEEALHVMKKAWDLWDAKNENKRSASLYELYSWITFKIRKLS